MRATVRRVLGAGSIAVLLALVAVADVAARGVDGGLNSPSPPPVGSPQPSADQPVRSGASQGLSLRGAIELIVLVAAVAGAVAFYSATAGERGGTRVPARVRRR